MSLDRKSRTVGHRSCPKLRTRAVILGHHRVCPIFGFAAQGCRHKRLRTQMGRRPFTMPRLKLVIDAMNSEYSGTGRSTGHALEYLTFSNLVLTGRKNGLDAATRLCVGIL